MVLFAQARKETSVFQAYSQKDINQKNKGGERMIENIIACVIAVILGGVVTPMFLNWVIDKWGWFK